jgi:CBS domain containing-hemolysin-like protein
MKVKPLIFIGWIKTHTGIIEKTKLPGPGGFCFLLSSGFSFILDAVAPSPLIALAVVFVFGGASFFFALAETALFSLSKWQARQMSESNARAGQIVMRLLAAPQDLLATMVLGNTFASAAILATALWMALSRQWPMAATVAGLLVLILIGCEVVPKTLAVRNPERWALRVARPLQLVQSLSLPLRKVAQQVNSAMLRAVVPRTVQPQTAMADEDYQELLDLAFQQGTLGQSEREIILQIISLDRRTVKEVMRPRAQMSAISDDLSIEEMVEAARKYKHRRLPIYDGTPDTIVGVLNTRALLLDPQIDLVDAIEFPSFVPEAMNLLQLLKSLQRQRRHMAMVLDEFGGTAGMVTMGDILEEMVGKIRRETDVESFLMESLGTGRWRVSGTLRLDDFRREYPPLGDVPEAETMGGLLMSLLDVVPSTGDSVVFRGLKLTAQVADERRVREVLVEKTK